LFLLTILKIKNKNKGIIMKALIKSNNCTYIKDINIPEIDNVNNVLIKIELAAICRTDLKSAKNLIPSADNIVLGHEFYGRIIKLSPQVKEFKIGDKVTIDPTKFGEAKNLMCGVDVDGAFAEYIKVPDYVIYKLPEELLPEYSAYIEPVAASLAVLKAKLNKTDKGCVYGKNRIAELTLKILKLYGYENCSIVDSKDELVKDSYDYIIETVSTSDDMEKIVNAIKPEGTIVLKSRQYNPVSIVINTLVRKDIKMIAVSYGDFNEAIQILSSGKLNIDDLIGEIYDLEDFETAFTKAEDSEAKKLYLRI